jgi:hypothetical protein
MPLSRAPLAGSRRVWAPALPPYPPWPTEHDGIAIQTPGVFPVPAWEVWTIGPVSPGGGAGRT